MSSYSSSSAAVGSNGSTRGGSSASTAAAPMRPGIRPQRIAAQDVRLRRRLDRRIAAAVRPQSLLIPDIIEHGYIGVQSQHHIGHPLRLRGRLQIGRRPEAILLSFLQLGGCRAFVRAFARQAAVRTCHRSGRQHLRISCPVCLRTGRAGTADLQGPRKLERNNAKLPTGGIFQSVPGGQHCRRTETSRSATQSIKDL